MVRCYDGGNDDDDVDNNNNDNNIDDNNNGGTGRHSTTARMKWSGDMNIAVLECYYLRQLCGKCKLERASNWYEQKPEGVVESEHFKILWDFTIQCDRKIEARRPDIVFVDKKEREVVIIYVAIPGDDRVKDKELEKLEK